MQGRLGLLGFVGQVQQELADPAKIDWTLPAGPLGLERQRCDFAKRAVAYGASIAVQTYMQNISDKQELLGVLADCLIGLYAMDSAISRALQLVESRGEAKSEAALWMTQLFVAQTHERIFDNLREMLMWISEESKWGKEVSDINNYYRLSRVNTFSLRRRIAKHMLEAGGYSVAPRP
jgi:butyryl-CoA dehydrogenase